MATSVKYNPARTTIGIYILALLFIVSFNSLKGSTHTMLEEVPLVVESWMTAPFESTVAETELLVESWMTAPFESSMAESELLVESWMTAPFESSMAESELLVESWMTAPF